ncbi:MAG: hypothetical protein GX567_06730, partial [Clostridia bacterium]|nr:hypothetical protein [Clostridia bacterium]
NGGAWSPFAECIQLISGNYSMRICDDNIIEYAVLEGEYWRKTYYECDTLSLAKGIAGIIDSELKDNGVDFDNDVSDFYYNAGGADIPLSETQKIMLGIVLRSNNWKEEDGQANRFFTFMLDKENVGTLGVVREGGIYFQQDGITYAGDNVDSANDIEYILFNYEYPGAEMNVSINDSDYKEIISINDENRAQFENFVNYDLPSMLVPISINSSANDSPLKYSLSIAYKTGEMEIRTVDFSIHDSGFAERLDYVLDPVMTWAPSGDTVYTIDLAAFEEKLDELKNNKPAAKKEETTEAVTEDVQTTTEPQTITMIEKQETSIAPDETIPMSDDDRAYFSTETGIFVFDEDDKLIASPSTHDGIQLEKFALDKFIPMLTSIEENTRFGSDEIPYVIIRKYNAGGNRILRDGYYIYDDGYVSICSYEYMDGDWIPAGCKSFEMNYEEFKSLLDATLTLSELHD